MAELKTKATQASVEQFLNKVADEKRRKDCFVLVKLMKQITKREPKMWGSSIIGFGNYHYKYASGREGDWMLTAFSPRKQDLTVYIMSGLGRYPDLMKKLGKHKSSKACLYIKRLDDIDIKILKELIEKSIADLRSNK